MNSQFESIEVPIRYLDATFYVDVFVDRENPYAAVIDRITVFEDGLTESDLPPEKRETAINLAIEEFNR